MPKTRGRAGTIGVTGVMIAALIFILGGCIGPGVQRSGVKGQPRKGKPSAIYSDFGDVLIPSALQVDNRSSYVVQSPGLATGVLALKGRVRRDSLIDFFSHNMAKDNWRIVTLFKSPRTSTVMLFKKENRWCVISISEKEFNTYVQIGVAPTMNTVNQNPMDEGLLK